MADLKVLPKESWTSPEQVIGDLEKLLERAKAGDFISFTWTAERRDGQVEEGSTRTENCFAVGGHMIATALKLMNPSGNFWA